eukprot:m.59089 g.59089  ORF g.59089 m.59089 type:complete len:419 (-) comp7897_c0_seq8:38-1294(-)
MWKLLMLFGRSSRNISNNSSKHLRCCCYHNSELFQQQRLVGRCWSGLQVSSTCYGAKNISFDQWLVEKQNAGSRLKDVIGMKHRETKAKDVVDVVMTEKGNGRTTVEPKRKERGTKLEHMQKRGREIKPSIPKSKVNTYHPKHNHNNEDSKRKEFKAIFVPKPLYEELDSLELGKRRNRRRPFLIKISDWDYVCESTPSFRKKLKFIAAAKTPTSFIPAHPGVKEVCFIGRSNAGKSSLLNALSRTAPARTEDKPGVTQSVNFYQLEKTSLNVVDLPGYGFAFGKEEKKKEFMNTAIEFLKNREILKRTFVLIDARLPLKKSDWDFMKLLDEEGKSKFQVVMTKCDLVDLKDLCRRKLLAEKELNNGTFTNNIKEVLCVSATSGAGVRNLRKAIMDATGIKSGKNKELGTVITKGEED